MEQAKQFYRSLCVLVIPIAIQNLITSAVNSADVFMLGYVGQNELSAVSLANQLQFIIGGFFFGIASGITILCSQYWGKRDTDSIQVVMGIAFKISFALCTFFSIAAIFFPETVMRIYTNDETLIPIGVEYLRIIGISYVMLSVSQVYQSTLRSIEKAHVATIISCIALSLNILLNGVFIFGLFGIPKMGVIGVGIATTIARTIEMLLCLGHLFFNHIFKVKFKLILKWNKVLLVDYLKYSIPALMNDIIWTLAFSMYSVIMGHMNPDIVAANSVASTVRNLCSVVCFGISSGGSVLLGIEMGEGRLETAKADAWRLIKVSIWSGIGTGIVILLLKPVVFCFVNLTDRAADYLVIMLYISAYYVIGQVVNTVTIAGIFRAGGDSKFGLWCDTLVMWGISVVLGCFSAFVFKWPPMVTYFILCLDEFWKIPLVIWRYRQYKWLKNITRDTII